MFGARYLISRSTISRSILTTKLVPPFRSKPNRIFSFGGVKIQIENDSSPNNINHFHNAFLSIIYSNQLLYINPTNLRPKAWLLVIGYGLLVMGQRHITDLSPQ